MAEVKMEKNSIVIEEEPKDKPEKKDIQPVVKGQVKVQKKSVLKRVVDAFVGEDVGDVKEYLIYDVAIPSIKNLFFDLISNGASMALFGTSTRNDRRSGSSGRRRSGGSSYFSYSSIGDRRNDREYARPNRRAMHDFSNIVYTTREDAEDVWSGLTDLIEIYGVATVRDLYDLSNMTNVGSFTDRGFGWSSLGPCRVVPIYNKEDRCYDYILDLPPVETL